MLTRVTVKEYHANAKAFLEAGFFEKSSAKPKPCHSVHVWSTYESA